LDKRSACPVFPESLGEAEIRSEVNFPQNFLAHINLKILDRVGDHACLRLGPTAQLRENPTQ
jgi:hypothetical protein